MGKIKIRTGRGTGTIEVDDNPAKWSGDEYRKIQAARKKAAANRMVHTGRGTGSKRLGDIPDAKAKTLNRRNDKSYWQRYWFKKEQKQRFIVNYLNLSFLISN